MKPNQFIYSKPIFDAQTLNRKSTEFGVLYSLIEEVISYFHHLPPITPKFEAKLRKAKDAMRKFSNICGVIDRDIIAEWFPNKEEHTNFTLLVKQVLALPFSGQIGQDKIVALNQIVNDEAFMFVDDNQYAQEKADLALFAKMKTVLESNKAEVTITTNRLYRCVINGQETIGLTFFEALIEGLKKLND